MAPATVTIPRYSRKRCRLALVGSLVLGAFYSPVGSFSPLTSAEWRGRHHSTIFASLEKAPPSSPDNQSKRNESNKSNKSFKNKRRPTGKQQIMKMFKKANDLERRGQWRKASDLLNKILETKPNDAHSHLALAKLEARRFPDTDRALVAFERGIQACPQSVHILQAWAVHEESNGRIDRARELFQQCLDLDPTNPYACHAFGLLERKLGNSKEARKLWNHALQKQSTAALVCQMGELLIETGELKTAEKLYKHHLRKLRTRREKTEVQLAAAWLQERYFKNNTKAEELIKSALTLNPSSSKALVSLARLEGRRNHRSHGDGSAKVTAQRFESICQDIENNGKVKSDDGRVYNAWASIERKANRLQSARRILQKGLSLHPKDHSLLQAAGKLEEKVGNYTGARAMYRESLKVQPSAPTLVAYAMLEMLHPQSGKMNFTYSCRLFEEAILVDPRHGPAYNSYGNAQLRIGSIQEARSIFERGVKARCPDAASVYHGYAQLELSVGNIRQARELLTCGVTESRRQDVGKDSPHRERAVFLTHTLGMLELNSNRPVDASAIFMDGIDRFGNSSQLLLGAALCEVKMGSEDKARTLFERSVLNNEKHAQAWQAWGVMELRAGNWKSATTLFDCGVKTSPRHGALWLAYSIAEGRLGNTEKARSLFASGIKNAPNHVPLYQAWASFELKEGNYETAKTLITAALTRDKRNGSGWLVAAEIEKGLGNLGLVNLLLRRGIECAPSYAQLYRALGDCLYQEGDVNEARLSYEKGIEVDPMHAPLYHSLAELEARIFNIEGLAELNKKAAKIFNTNVLEPPADAGEEAWGKKIRASRLRNIPQGIKALAQRVVKEDKPIAQKSGDPIKFTEEIEASLMEDGLLGDLLNVDQDLIKRDEDNDAK